MKIKSNSSCLLEVDVCCYCRLQCIVYVWYFTGVRQCQMSAFSALMLLVGQWEEHLARKKLSDELLVWLSVWSEVQMTCIWSS